MASGLNSSLPYGTLLDAGNARWNTNHDPGTEKELAASGCFAYEIAEHFLGDVVIRNHSVRKGRMATIFQVCAPASCGLRNLLL